MDDELDVMQRDIENEPDHATTALVEVLDDLIDAVKGNKSGTDYTKALGDIAATILKAAKMANDDSSDILIAKQIMQSIEMAAKKLADAVATMKAFDGGGIVQAINSNTKALTRMAEAYESPKRVIVDRNGNTLGVELGEPE